MELEKILESLGGVSGTVSTVIVFIFALFLIFHALRGIKRGLFGQLLHAVIMICAAVISYFVSNAIWDKFFAAFTDEGISTLVGSLSKSDALSAVMTKIEDVLLAFEPETFSYLMSMPAALIVIPALFSLTFILVNAVLRIVYLVLSKILFFIKINGLVPRLLAILLGAAEGVIIAAMILLPVTSAVDLIDDSVTALCEGGERPELQEAYDEYISPVSKNPVFSIIKFAGGDLLLDKMSKLEAEEGVIDLRSEFHNAIVIVDGAKDLKGCDFKTLSAVQKQSLRSVISGITSSDYYATILSGLLSGISINLGQEGLPFEIDSQLLPIVNEVILIFKDESPETLEGDLDTILSVYFIFADSGALVAMTEGGDATACLAKKDADGKTYIEKAKLALEGNDRTKGLVSAIARLSVSIMAGSLGEDAGELYDDIREQVNSDILSIEKESFATEEEYREELSSTLNEKLTDNGIVLEEEIVDSIADYVADNFSDKTHVSEEEFNDILFSYYDAYLEYMSKNAN